MSLAQSMSSGNMVKAPKASAASDRARSFVLAALRAFDRPGIDLDQVVKSKLDGKFLPLPAQTGASAPEKITSNAPKSRAGPSTSRGVDFHSQVHSRTVKLNTLATRYRPPLTKTRARDCRRKPLPRKSPSHLSYSVAEHVLGTFSHYVKVPPQGTHGSGVEDIGLSLN